MYTHSKFTNAVVKGPRIDIHNIELLISIRHIDLNDKCLERSIVTNVHDIYIMSTNNTTTPDPLSNTPITYIHSIRTISIKHIYALRNLTFITNKIQWVSKKDLFHKTLTKPSITVSLFP